MTAKKSDEPARPDVPLSIWDHPDCVLTTQAVAGVHPDPVPESVPVKSATHPKES